MNQKITSLDAALDDLEEIISVGLWHWTAGTQEFAWSKQLYKITGQDPAIFQPTLDSTFALIHPDDREGTMTKLLGVVATQEPYEHEFRILRADGEVRVCWAKVRPVIEEDVVVAVRGTCLDVTYLREAEAQAKETEENYRYTIELSPQIPWTADRFGNVLSMGATWTRITGLPVHEALGSGWLRYTHPDDLDVAHSLLGEAQAENPAVDFRYRLRCLNGAYRWVRTRAYPRRDEQGEVIRWYGLTEDIHEQVEAEQRLRESEEHYRYTVELSPQIPWTANEHGNLTGVSSRWSEVIGMSEEEAQGQGWAAALHPDDAVWALPAWKDSLISGEPFDMRFRLRLASGEYSWFRVYARARRDEKNQIVCWYGVAEDVDEQVRTEKALKKAEERYRLATRATNDLIWDFDAATGRLEWTRSLDVFGYRAEELGTDLRWWEDHIHPEDRAAALHKVHQALSSSEQQFICEYRFRRADGSYATVFSRGYVVRDEHGRAVRTVGAMQDLSQRKAAEEKAHWGARHDALTELPNRRLFYDRLQQALACASAQGSKVGLLHLDVDHFKQVNDSFGHAAGDALLRKLASRLRQAVRSGDTVARLGGDEFAVILPGASGAEDVSKVAQTLLERMREP
uniref:PAS domain-containing protein n=1 Tax=Altericroceibacterium xinjiangense TaxID=762261 RepID=UPI000F7F5968